MLHGVLRMTAPCAKTSNEQTNKQTNKQVSRNNKANAYVTLLYCNFPMRIDLNLSMQYHSFSKCHLSVRIPAKRLKLFCLGLHFISIFPVPS